MSPQRLSFGKKLAFSLVTAAAVLLAVEGLLWALGRPTVLEQEDPFRGFSGLVSVFERQGDVYRTRPAQGYVTFNDQSFLAEKPDGGFRFFCLGGSSAYGFPWDASRSFCGVLGDVLTAEHPDRRIEAVNAAGISYAVHRLRFVTREVVTYDPDLLIVYSGHNEFVEPAFFEALRDQGAARRRFEYLAAHSRIYATMRRLLRPAPAPPPDAERFELFVRRESTRYSETAKREVVEAYETGLREIVGLARERGIRVVLATVPANLRAWPPMASAVRPDLDEAGRRRWESVLAVARQELDQGRFAEAVTGLTAAAAIDPGHAETWFLLGRAREGLGESDAAREAFDRACDLDASPVRRVSGINDAVRRVAADEGALLVDVEKWFEERSEGGLIGFNWIEDYVHPTLRGHEEIAWLLWQAIEASGLITPTAPADRDRFDAILAARPTPPAQPTAAWLFNQGAIARHQGLFAEAAEKFREALDIAPDYEGALINLGQLLLQDGNVEEAADLAGRLQRLDPGNPDGLVLSGRVALLRGDPAGAAAGFRRATARAPGSVAAWFNLGLALESAGETAEAQGAFRRAIDIQPDHALAHYRLGSLLRQAGDVPAASSSLQRAAELEPDRVEVHVDLGTLYQQTGDIERATAEFRRVLELDPQNRTAHNNLGVALHAAGRLDEAIEHYRAVLRVAPDEAAALTNLALALQARGRAAEGIELLRRAVEVAPAFFEARINLAQGLHARGDLSGAIEQYEQALRLRPGFARGHFGLARALAATGDRERAREHLAEAVRLDPSLQRAAEGAE